MIDLERSKIAFGVSRTSSKDIPFDVNYKVSSACGCSRCDIWMDFEQDEKTPGWMYLNFYKKVGWNCHWDTKGWWQAFVKRFSGALTLLFRGSIELEEAFMLDGPEHIDGFIAALQEGKDKMLDSLEQEKAKS